LIHRKSNNSSLYKLLGVALVATVALAYVLSTGSQPTTANIRNVQHEALSDDQLDQLFSFDLDVSYNFMHSPIAFAGAA